MFAEQTKHGEESHYLMGRINEIANKALSESEGYHARVKEFKEKIGKLESEINDKQSQMEKNAKYGGLREK
jgi:hypothetical protein